MMIKQHWYILAIALWTIFVLPLLITTSYVSGQDDNVDLAGQERLRNIDIIFSIDSSGSMAPPPPEVPEDEHNEFNRDPDNLRIKGVQQFMKQLTSAYHWVGLVSWDSDIDLSVNLTNKYNVVQSALEIIDGKGGTDLEMGLREALKLHEVAIRKQSKKIVLLLTDGEGSVGDDVISMAKELMVTVYTVGLSVTPQAESVLTRIADETGGVYFSAPTAANLQIIFDKIFKKEVGSGIELVGMSEQNPPPYKWLVYDSQKSKLVREEDGGWGFTPLKPGNYHVFLVQKVGEKEIYYNNIQVLAEKVTKVEVGSGINLEGWLADSPPPYHCCVYEVDTDKLVAKVQERWGFIPVPPGKYYIALKEKDGESELRYTEVEVKEGIIEKVKVKIGLAFLAIETKPGAITMNQSAQVEVDLYDISGQVLQVSEPISVTLSSSQGVLEENVITIPTGEGSASTKLSANDYVGLVTVTASTKGLSAKATVVFVKTVKVEPDVIRDEKVDLVIDQPGVAVNQPMAIKSVLTDNAGDPIQASQNLPLIFNIEPIDMLDEVGSGVAAGSDNHDNQIDNLHRMPSSFVDENKQIEIKNGETVKWKKKFGPLTIKVILQKGEAVCSFNLLSLEATILKIALKTKGTHEENVKSEIVAAAKPGTPTRLKICAKPKEFIANGIDSSQLKVLLVNDAGEPTFSPNKIYDLHLESSLGLLSIDETEIVTSNGLFTKEKIFLTASTAGTAVVDVTNPETGLCGLTQIRLLLVQPTILLLIFAALGGVIGGLLKRYKKLSGHGSRPQLSDLIDQFLVVNLLTGLIFYLSVYYGCYHLSVPFYKHVVYTILIGTFGGYVGVTILDKIVEKLGLQKKGA